MIDRVRRIALAVDRSEESDHACDLAARLSVDTGAADLLVVGGRGEDELTRRMLLGSTPESLVRHAPCSVLVARRPLGTNT